jgi:hypothetical protein
VDHKGNFFCVSFYNVGKSFIENVKFSSSNLVIIDPLIKNINIEQEKSLNYICCQTTDLSKVLVDGKYCSNFASTALLNSKFFN